MGRKTETQAYAVTSANSCMCSGINRMVVVAQLDQPFTRCLNALTLCQLADSLGMLMFKHVNLIKGPVSAN